MAGRMARLVESASDLSTLRGPAAPFRLCPECGAQTEAPWENPILAVGKKHGFYHGETTGGEVLCASCEPIVEARHARKAPAPPTLTDCPYEFQRVVLDDYLTNPGALMAIEAAYRFMADGAEDDLYLCGAVGVGKTHLACAIGNTLVARQPSARFVRVHTLLLKLQEGMNDTAESTRLSDYVEPALLILDDIGVEKGSDYSRRTLQTLYDMRRDVGRRTIWTSNLDLNQLAAFLGDDRLPSRITGAADVVWLEGDDLRARRGVRVGRQTATGRD